MLHRVIEKIRNVPFTWTLGYYAGRIAAHNATQRHWADTVASLTGRAERAENRATTAEIRARVLLGEAQRLRAILQTRNLSGGWMPNGQI